MAKWIIPKHRRSKCRIGEGVAVKWIIRRAKDGEYLRTIEAPNRSMAMKRAYANGDPLEKLSVRSAVSERITEEERYAFERRKIRESDLDPVDKQRAYEQLRQEYGRSKEKTL